MRGAAIDDARVNDAQPMAARRQVRIDLLEQTLAQAVQMLRMVVSSGSASVNRSPTKRLTDSTS